MPKHYDLGARVLGSTPKFYCAFLRLVASEGAMCNKEKHPSESEEHRLRLSITLDTCPYARPRFSSVRKQTVLQTPIGTVIDELLRHSPEPGSSRPAA